MSRTRQNFIPVELPHGGCTNLYDISTVDVVPSNSGPQIALRAAGGGLLSLLPVSLFAEHFTDDPFRIARSFTRMIVALTSGARIERPKWIVDDWDEDDDSH